MGNILEPVNDLEKCYKVSEDVVARKIEDEIIIVPLVAGIGDMEDELFTLNETGEAIWDRLDGSKSLKDIVSDLEADYENSKKSITNDVVGFVHELVKRGIIVEVTR